MEVIAFDVDRFHLLVRDFTANRVGIGVELAMYLESGLCGGSSNEVHHHVIADERLS